MVFKKHSCVLFLKTHDLNSAMTLKRDQHEQILIVPSHTFGAILVRLPRQQRPVIQIEVCRLIKAPPDSLLPLSRNARLQQSPATLEQTVNANFQSEMYRHPLESLEVTCFYSIPSFIGLLEIRPWFDVSFTPCRLQFKAPA